MFEKGQLIQYNYLFNNYPYIGLILEKQIDNNFGTILILFSENSILKVPLGHINFEFLG
jgi:hypothetical protein